MSISDPDQTREYWTEVVRSAADRGKLEKIPTRLAETKKDRDTARKQSRCITTKSFGGFHPNYERIVWTQKKAKQ